VQLLAVRYFIDRLYQVGVIFIEELLFIAGGNQLLGCFECFEVEAAFLVVRFIFCNFIIFYPFRLILISTAMVTQI